MKNPTTSGADEKITFIKLARKTRQHWLWKASRKKTKFEAWLDLLFRANFEDNKELYGHDLIELKRGDILCSQEGLAKDWGWDRSAVRYFLKILQDDSMIHLNVTQKFTVITLCNYERYNVLQPKEQQQDNNRTTSKQQQNNTYKNRENIENVEEQEEISFDWFWDAYGKKVGRKDVEAKWDKLTHLEKAQIKKMLHIYVAKTPELKYRKDPKTFLNARVWEDDVYVSPVPVLSVLRAVEVREDDTVLYDNGKIMAAPNWHDVEEVKAGRKPISALDRKAS